MLFLLLNLVSVVYATDCIRETSNKPGCMYNQCEIDTCGIDSWCCDVNWDGICKDFSSRSFFSCWCPGPEVGHIFRHPDKCKKYYICDYNQQTYNIFHCPKGTMFSNELKYCDWAINFDEEECPRIKKHIDPLCENHMDGNPFLIEGTCDKYGVCGHDGEVTIHICETGVFNPEKSFCDHEHSLPDSNNNGVPDFCDQDDNQGGNDECESNFNIQLINIGENTDFDEYFEKAKKRWECIIIGDLSDFSAEDAPPNWFHNDEYIYNGPVDDLVIGYRVDYIDGPGDQQGNILGFAGPIYTRNSNKLPISGIMVFDSYDINEMENEGILEGVILHEMGHVFGLVGILDKGLTNCVNSANDHPYYLGALAQQAYNALGFVGTLPIEMDFGPGSKCAHWNENTDGQFLGLGDELMTPQVDTVMPLSDITISSLEDAGYQVDHSQADPFGPASTNARRRRNLLSRSRRNMDRFDLKNDNACDFGYCPIVLK